MNMNNSSPPNNFNNSNSVVAAAAAANPTSPGRGGFVQVKVKTGAPVNEAVNFPFMGRVRDAQQQLHQQQQQLQHQQPLTHNNIMPRSSSHPMMMNIDVHDSTANEPMATSNQMWMNPPIGDVDVGVGNNEPLSFNVENPAPPAADGIQMFEDMLFNVNEGKRIKRGWANQRSYSEPTLSILADVFDTIDASDFNENIHLGLESTPTVDGWASPPPPPVFDKVAPSNNDRNRNGGGMQQHSSRKRSSSEPFMITDIFNELQEFEPQNMFDGRLAGDSSNNRTFRSATAPPEWGEFEEEIERKAKRGNSFTMGQVMLNGQHEFDDNFLFGQTPSTSATSFLTSSATSSPAHQAGSNTPALNDFTLALCAVQETQTNLRTLQPLIMQLGNLAAMEEISIASKLTASSSQYILTSDLPNVYACLNDAWERIKKLEDLLSMSAAAKLQQEPQQQQQPQGHNNLSELQMMLTHGSTGVPSPGGVMSNYPSSMVTLTPSPRPLFQPNPINHGAPIPPTTGAFAPSALAATNKTDPIGNAKSTSDAGVPSKLKNTPILVKTMTPLPKANISPCNTTALATSATPSLPSIPSIGKNDGDLKDLPPPSNTDPDIIMKRLQALMERTQMSQKRLQVSTMY